MNTRITIQNIYYPPLPEYDPLNPPRTVPGEFNTDETLPTASELADRLKGVTRESDLRRIIWEAFRDQFIHEIAGDRGADDYRDAAFDAWKYYCR